MCFFKEIKPSSHMKTLHKHHLSVEHLITDSFLTRYFTKAGFSFLIMLSDQATSVRLTATLKSSRVNVALLVGILKT